MNAHEAFYKVASAVIIGLALWMLVIVLTGCATSPPTQVTGNGYCRPAQDLPTHKAVEPVPEQDTTMTDLYVLLLQERKQHAADDRDYNSLYTTCVGPSK